VTVWTDSGEVKIVISMDCWPLGRWVTATQSTTSCWCCRLLLWDCDDRSYSYYIVVSVNMCDWHMVVDKRTELCKSWQLLRFKRQPVVYIRIVGTHNTANEVTTTVSFTNPAPPSRRILMMADVSGFPLCSLGVPGTGGRCRPCGLESFDGNGSR